MPSSHGHFSTLRLLSAGPLSRAELDTKYLNRDIEKDVLVSQARLLVHAPTFCRDPNPHDLHWRAMHQYGSNFSRWLHIGVAGATSAKQCISVVVTFCLPNTLQVRYEGGEWRTIQSLTQVILVSCVSAQLTLCLRFRFAGFLCKAFTLAHTHAQHAHTIGRNEGTMRVLAGYHRLPFCWGCRMRASSARLSSPHFSLPTTISGSNVLGANQPSSARTLSQWMAGLITPVDGLLNCWTVESCVLGNSAALLVVCSARAA